MGTRPQLLLVLVALVSYVQSQQQAFQQYWQGPPNNVWNWQPQQQQQQQMPAGAYYPQYQQQPQQQSFDQGPVWQSHWVPIRDFNQLNFNPSGNYYPTPGGGFGSQREAENYAKQFYPQLFAPPPPPQPQMRPNDPLTDVYPWGSPGYGQAVPWGQPQGQQGREPPPFGVGIAPPGGGPYQEPPMPLQEVIASCERDYCYRSCRLALAGGGRCTKAGCMCYHSYFDHEGNPLAYRYPEDYIWHSLKESQRRNIMDAMREGRPRRPPPTKPPKLPPLPPAIVGGQSASGGGGYTDPRTPDRPSPMFGGDEMEEEEDPWGEEDVLEEEEDPWGSSTDGAGSDMAEEEEEEEVEEEPAGGGGDWWAAPEPEPEEDEEDDPLFGSGDEEEDPFGFDDEDPFA